VRQVGGPLERLELAAPRALQADEVLLDVRACGIGNWDEFVRTGGCHTGSHPPMALSVEAAEPRRRSSGTASTVSVSAMRMTTHSLPNYGRGVLCGSASSYARPDYPTPARTFATRCSSGSPSGSSSATSTRSGCQSAGSSRRYSEPINCG